MQIQKDSNVRLTGSKSNNATTIVSDFANEKFTVGEQKPKIENLSRT